MFSVVMNKDSESGHLGGTDELSLGALEQHVQTKACTSSFSYPMARGVEVESKTVSKDWVVR